MGCHGCCNSCCDGCPFVRLFIGQFFDIGYNCGSFISEALGLIKTFQRLSATISFKTRFSPECIAMFSWATDIVDIFASAVETNPLNEFENYYLFSIVLPITILVYISSVFNQTPVFIGMLLLYGVCIMFGTGLSFIGIDNVITGFLITIPIIIFLIILMCIYCGEPCDCSCCSCSCQKCTISSIKENVKNSNIDGFVEGNAETRTLILGLPPTIFIFYVLLIPIQMNRENLIIALAIIAAVITALYIIIYFLLTCCCDSVLDNEGEGLINLLTMILSLLVVPSTEHFVELMQSKYKNDWRCILTYIGLSLIFPMLITLFNIMAEHHVITAKYKEKNAFTYYIELIDTVHLLTYALFAGYDIIWGCVFIEIAWVAFIIWQRPYQDISEYVLLAGNALVTLIGNCAILYANDHDPYTFSFGFSVFLVVFAIAQAVAAMYVYFCVDFDPDPKYLEKNREMNSFVVAFSTIVAPVSFVFFGLNLALIDGKVIKPEY